MDNWVGVSVIAFFIWGVFGIGGFIANGGLHQNATEPFTHYQAMNFSFGFVAAGFFLVFFYPYAGFGIGGFGLILLIKSGIDYMLWVRKNRKENKRS